MKIPDRLVTKLRRICTRLPAGYLYDILAQIAAYPAALPRNADMDFLCAERVIERFYKPGFGYRYQATPLTYLYAHMLRGKLAELLSENNNRPFPKGSYAPWVTSPKRDIMPYGSMADLISDCERIA